MTEPTLFDVPPWLDGKVDVVDEHWLWRGARTTAGYGTMRRNGGYAYAHRLTYEAFVGPLLPGLEIDHLCKTPPCCNPAHLEQVSHRVNVLRSDSPSAVAARRTACAAGHDYVDGSFIVRRGARECLECRRAGLRRSYKKRRGLL